MLDCLPEFIEPLGLAEVGRSFSGAVSVARLSRLLPNLSSREGELLVQLVFHTDERRIRVLEGTIQGQLSLVCQRCLNTLRFPIDLCFRLGIVTSEAEIDRLPQGYEPLLVSGEPLHTVEVVEDEVILALPTIPVHKGLETCDVGYKNQHSPAKSEHPFAVLEKLKT